MYKKKLLIYLTLLSVIFNNCNPKEIDANRKEFNSFPKTSQITFQAFFKPDNNKKAEAILFTDTTIITVNTDNLTNDYLFYEYNKSSKEMIGRYIEWGAAKNKIIAPMSYGLHNQNKLWVHDISLNKVLILPLENKNNFDSILEHQSYKIPEFSYSIQLLQENKILKSGLFNVKEYLQIAQLENATVEKTIGVFKKPSEKHTLNIWKAAYEGFLFLKNDERKAVIACRYTDRIEIFDLELNTMKKIIGPLKFDPVFFSKNENSHDNFIMSRTEKTTFGYLGGSVTNKYIYLLFSGKLQKEENFNLSNEIFVFDWEGNPIKKLLLDRVVSHIAVSDDDKIIYASDPNLNLYVTSNLEIN